MKHDAFPLKQSEGGAVTVGIQTDDGAEVQLTPTELMATLIGKLRTYKLVEGEDAEKYVFAFAVPKAFPPEHTQALLDSALVAGLDGQTDVLVTTTTDALLATYRQKHPASEFQAGESNIYVIQHTHTHIHTLESLPKIHLFPRLYVLLIGVHTIFSTASGGKIQEKRDSSSSSKWVMHRLPSWWWSWGPKAVRGQWQKDTTHR